MIVILASQADEQAHVLAKRWEGAVLTPADLSQPGWRFEVGGDDNPVAVIGGQIIRAGEITGVLTRLVAVSEDDLPGIDAADRNYVANEMHAFLMAWLDSLPCPVLNPPSPNCLCGPADRLPESILADGGDAVLLIDGEVCGPATQTRAQAAQAIASTIGAPLVEIRFKDDRPTGFSLIPDLSTDEACDAVYRLLISGPRARWQPRRQRAAHPRTGPVVLWGLPADGPLSDVHRELQAMDAPVFFIDQRDVLETSVCCSRLKIRAESVDLESIRSLYVRSYNSASLPHVDQAGEEAQRSALEIDSRITRWAQRTEAFVVSPLDAMSANHSKPFQSRWIASFGWRVPRTLITTDPVEARRFWETHREIIYKSVSSVRSQVSRVTTEHAHRLADIVNCPTQFQEYIPGVDYRVHVVGEAGFACRIETSSDDYRYGESDFSAATLSPEIEERCRAMSSAMSLPFSGIDLRLTPEGEWVCFEVNPSPGFSVFEEQTGHPIAAAVARLLLNPPVEPR